MDQSEEFYVTEQGLADMKKELDYLKTEKTSKGHRRFKRSQSLR